MRTRIVTKTRTGLEFSSAESCPSAEEVIDKGMPIINRHGNLALSEIAEDGETIVLDRETVPPTLHFNSASVVALAGYSLENGQFVRYNNEAAEKTATVSGKYTGPGSQLNLA